MAIDLYKTLMEEEEIFLNDDNFDNYLNSLGVNVEKCEEEQWDDWVEKYLV